MMARCLGKAQRFFANDKLEWEFSLLVRKRLSFKAMTRRQTYKSFPLNVLILYEA